MKKFNLNRRSIYAWTLGLWGACLLIYFCFYVVSRLSGPLSPDVYANTFSFQIIAFALTVLPYWLMGLLIVLFSEFALFRKHIKPKDSL